MPYILNIGYCYLVYTYQVTIGYNFIIRLRPICKAVFLTFKSKRTAVR